MIFFLFIHKKNVAPVIFHKINYIFIFKKTFGKMRFLKLILAIPIFFFFNDKIFHNFFVETK